MRFPSWTDFKNGLDNFEEKITEFKDKHPNWDRVILGVLPLLPPPFDAIAQNIYSSYGDSGDGSKAVLSYLRYLEDLGENHYNQIALQLDNLLVKIDDIKQVTAKESTLQNIQEILISSGNVANEKLDLLKNQLVRIEVIVDKIDTAVAKGFEEVNHKLNSLLEKQGIPTQLDTSKQIEIPHEIQKQIEALTQEKEYWKLEALKQNQELPPLDIDAELKQGNFYYYAKNYEKAIEYYDHILKVDPNHVDALKIGRASCRERV